MPILYEIGVSKDLWSLMDNLNHFDADLNHTLAYLLVLILVGTDWLSCTHKFLKLLLMQKFALVLIRRNVYSYLL